VTSFSSKLMMNTRQKMTEIFHRLYDKIEQPRLWIVLKYQSSISCYYGVIQKCPRPLLSEMDLTQDNSVNPAWRTALLHMIYTQNWPDGTSIEDQENLANHVTKPVEILQTVSEGTQSGAYMNGADPNELNWQQNFFETIQNYN